MNDEFWLIEFDKNVNGASKDTLTDIAVNVSKAVHLHLTNIR